RDRALESGVKLQARLPDPYEVGRGGRERPVDTEDGDPDFLARPDVSRHHQTIGRVPAGDHRTSALTDVARELSVHPDLRGVVEGRFEDDRLAGWVVAADPGRDRQAQPVPLKRELSAAPAPGQVRGRDCLPGGVVEFDCAGPRLDVPGPS